MRIFPVRGNKVWIHAFAYTVSAKASTPESGGENHVDTHEIPGYKAGTWTIDPTHSEVGFSIRHIMISKVKGTFEKFSRHLCDCREPSGVERHSVR